MQSLKTQISLFVFVAFVSIPCLVFSQAPKIQWQKCLGGPGVESSTSIIQTHDGGYALAGRATSDSADVSGNHGNNDAWIVKLTSLGNIQWQKCLGGSDDDVATCIIQTIDGGYVVVGDTKSLGGDVTGNHGNYRTDVWVVRLDSLGNLVWEKCFGGSGYDYANCVIQNSDGNYVIAGRTYSIDGDISGKHLVTYNSDAWILTIDTVGNILWQKCLGGTGDETAESIIQTREGGYIIAGSATSTNGDVKGYHPALDKNINSYEDAWIVKLNPAGVIEWQKCLGGSYPDWASSIVQSPDGGYVFAGINQSTDGDVVGNHGVVSGGSYEDAWIVKLDSSGNLLWQQSIGGIEPDRAFAIINTPDFGFIFCGTTYSQFEGVDNQGNYDAWIVKLNASGNILWQQRYGGGSYETAFSIVQTSDAGLAFTGDTQSTDGEVSGNHGGNDIWVVKLAAPLSVSSTISKSLTLSAHPNPVSKLTKLGYDLVKSSAVIISIFNITGDRMQQIKQGEEQIGHHEATLDLSSFAEGTYFIKVEAGEASETTEVKVMR